VVLGTLAAIGGHMFALAIPGYLRSLFDTLESNTNFDTLVFAVFAVLGMGLLEAIMVLLRRWLVLTPGTHVEAGLRRTLYAKLQDLEVAFHDKWPSGQLLSRASSDLSMIRRWLSFGLVLLVANLFTIVVGFTLLFSYNWILATVFVVIMSPLWVLGFKFEKEYHVTARMSQDQAGDLATSVEESVHGIRVIKSFGRGSFMTEKFARDALKLRSTELNKAKMIANLWFYFSTIPSLATGIYLPLGIWQIVEGNMTIGVLLSFILTTRILHWPIDSLGFLLSMTIDARSAVERFFEVIDTKVDISDPESPKTIKEPKGRLVFENVSFRYADAPAEQKDLIDGVNLEIEPGESVALIGITGSGKTSLTALATRLYEVTGGSVKLDGVDIRDLSREELRAHVVVYDLPDGLDTKIGEEGLSLSGGQRQRIALARAVAAQPAVLVLDDPLSALDVDTEAMVEDALRTVLKATTALIVAHRPSTVQLADKVALLQDGKITAFGKHSDLIATNDHYRYVISSLDAAGKMIEVNK